jgi:hypothetical protein
VSITGLQQRRTWRQLTSCLIAYAFAVQVALFGLAAPRLAALTADQDVLSAGLCLHDQDAPLAPAGNSGGDEHCKFCPAAAHTFVAPPATPHGFVMRTAEAAAATTGNDGFILRPLAHATAQPRGPPPTA